MGPILNEKSAQLHAVFAQAGKSGEVLNLSDVYYGFANEYVLFLQLIITWRVLATASSANK